jgi:DNA-binding NtrC family response regulator
MPAPVLVVHDELTVRELALTALGSAGHETVGLEDPMIALDTIEAAALAPVLITSVTFPAGKPNGISLGRMAKLKRPDIKAVFVGALEHQSLTEGLGDFLVMPFDPQALVDVVDRLLDRVPTCC